MRRKTKILTREVKYSNHAKTLLGMANMIRVRKRKIETEQRAQVNYCMILQARCDETRKC